MLRVDDGLVRAAVETAISLRAVSKSFEDATRAVADLSLDLMRGEILVLCGPSGCGKTTTLRMMAGFLTPDAGSVHIEGMEVAGGTWVPPERRPVGFVFQDYALFPHLTIAKNLAFGLPGREKGTVNRIVEQRLALVGLDGYGDRYPHELSGGEQQRVALARALAREPRVLLLDEPFSNLDASLRLQVRDEIRGILKAAGTSAVFVTHDQEEALALADRVAVLHKGRLEQIGTPEDVYHRPATRFVAGFIGQANFLPGEVSAIGIATELGRWPAPSGTIAGSRVEVMLRPHDVSLSADPSASSVVETRQFLGEENRYSVKLPSGRLILSTMPSHAVFGPGDRVAIEVDARHGVIFTAPMP